MSLLTILNTSFRKPVFRILTLQKSKIMKALLLFGFLISTFIPVLAQKSGEVEYKITVNVHKFLTGEMEQYKDFVPEFKTNHKLLKFNENFSIYENKEMEVKSADEHHGRGPFGGEPDNKRFTDLKEQTVLKKVDAFGKTYLVSGELESTKWKITGKSKMIQGVPCISAEFTDTNSTYTAWFTPTIPVQLGPEGYGSLPGLILEMVNKDSSIVIETMNLEKKEVSNEDIEKPKKGKEMTQKEFDKMVADKIKEFEERSGRKMPQGMRMF